MMSTASFDFAGTPGMRFPQATPFLVGRTLEQLLLREELAAVLAGRGRLVLLGGEAGIGKTALARDLAAAARDRGVRVLEAACYDLTHTPPYGPWLDLMEEAARDPDRPSPPAAFGGGLLESITDQAALFAEVRRFFADLAADRPLLLLLEDLHWADPASIDLLRHLAPRLRRWPILLLITYRAEELTRRHRFALQLPALVREADGLRLDLTRLDAFALRELVAARYRLAAPDVARLVAYLDRHAEGNSLFTVELLRTLEADGAIHPSDHGDGVWIVCGLDRAVVPPFLRHVIEGRVARLGEETCRLLAIASVIGQDVPLRLWAQVAGLVDELLFDAVEQAADAHLLEASPDGARVRFVHAITREAIYAGILPPRRAAWHRRIAEALVAGGHADPDEVAYHLQQAGDPRAWEWLIAAGDRAQRAYAWLTAAERLRAASALLAGVDGRERIRARLACRIAYLTRFSDPTAGLEALADAGRLAKHTGDAALAAEVRWMRGLLLCYLDRFRSGLAEMGAGLETLAAIPAGETHLPTAIQSWFAGALPDTAEPAGNRQLAVPPDAGNLHFWRGAALGRFLASAGHLQAAAVSCDRETHPGFVAGAAETEGTLDAAVAFATHGLGIVRAAQGRSEEARDAFSRAATIFAALGHHAMVAFTRLNELVDVALTFGAADPALRRRLAAEAEAALERTGGALRPGVSPRLAWLGCLVLDGAWQEANRLLDDLPDPGNAYLRREITAARATFARLCGDPERAWTEVRHLLPGGPSTEPGDLIHQEGLFLQRLAADLCLDAGDAETAQAWLDAHERWLAWSGAALGRAAGEVVRARCLLVDGDLAGARAAASEALAIAAVPDQPLVRLAAHRLLGELESVAKRHAAAGEHLAAALDLAAVCEAPYERALTLLVLAGLRAAVGNTAEAMALLEEAWSICGPLGAAPALARIDALAARLSGAVAATEHPSGLTARELDVLRLLPRGLSNAEIADTLFVSPRTVQTHLTNIYTKLGVGGRAEATAYAVTHGIA